jgi:hypothetical protein
VTAPLPPEIRALVLKTAIAIAEKELDQLTNSLKTAYPLPATIPFESPLDGAKLGYVQRALTTPFWKVTSEAQLLEYFTTELQESRDTGAAAAPGIHLVRAGQGNLSVVYDKKEAVGAITRMVRAGLIDWSGRPIEASSPGQVAS